MLRRLTLIATLCLFACPAAANASPDPSSDPLVRRWVSVAQLYWGASPPCLGGVDVVVGDWGPGGDTWAFAAPGGCWIVLRPTVYPMPAGSDPTWWRTAMCSTIAHEWGHLLGRAHSADPRALMYPYVPLDAVPGCAPGAAAPTVAVKPRRKRARHCARARRAAAKKRGCVRRSARNRRAHARARQRTRP
jgi:hypothetical protein